MFDKIVSFIHEDSFLAYVKGFIAWQASPAVSGFLSMFQIDATWLTKHEMGFFLAVLWAVDRLHQLYKEGGDSKPA